MDEEHIFHRLYALLLARKGADPASSYVASLYQQGRDRILQKVGEEAVETVLAAKNQQRQEIVHETADLWFHILVMLAEQDISPQLVFDELERRFHRSGKPAANEADRREHNRRFFNREVTLQFYNGMILQGLSRDVSLNGMLVECAYEPKWQLLGETGFFELHTGSHIHSFTFEVSRMTDCCLGINIIRDRGLFGFALSKEVFQDIFEEPPMDGSLE